jgi:hypothetical protein
MGIPGWPLFAASTASIAKARMAFAIGARRVSASLFDAIGRSFPKCPAANFRRSFEKGSETARIVQASRGFPDGFRGALLANERREINVTRHNRLQ